MTTARGPARRMSVPEPDRPAKEATMRLPMYLRWSRSYQDGLRHLHEGDHALAERELLAAVSTAEHIRPPDDRLGCSLYALARLRQVDGDLEGARRLYRRALAAESEALGPKHPFTLQIAHAYAGLLRQRAQVAAVRRRCSGPLPTPRTTPKPRPAGPVGGDRTGP
jgi:hypothetical protein